VNVIKLSAPATREFWEIPVLFEDEHLLALDKPAGLLTAPEGEDPEQTSLLRLLHDGIAAQKPWATQRGLTYLNNLSRLDAQTSGVLLLAKTKPAFITLADQFGIEKPLQKFFALIAGLPSSDRFEMDAKLSLLEGPLVMARVDSLNGKKCKTIFDVVEKFSGYTTLHCQPVTNRTHQIRAHLRHAGFPLAGDTLYGGKPLWLSRLKKDFRLKHGREERALISRTALHAEQLSVTHPVTNETVTITSPMPKDLRVALRYLREYRGGGQPVDAAD
jgi:RluA family pseudouridine synthase